MCRIADCRLLTNFLFTINPSKKNLLCSLKGIGTMRASWNCVSQLIRISLATKVPITRGLGCVKVHPSSFSQRLEVKFSSLAPAQVDLLQTKAVFPDRHQILQPQSISWSIWRTYAKKGKDKGMLLYFRNSIESMHPSQRCILSIQDIFLHEFLKFLLYICLIVIAWELISSFHII